MLRKKNVFVVFATQDVADVESSPLKTTIIQQCLTKIYLADPAADTAGMIDVYRAFGLRDSEITRIASARMKRDYFYTSPLGRRLFQLDLGRVQLALIGGADHAALDELVRNSEAGAPYRHLLGEDAPKKPERPVKIVPAVMRAGEERHAEQGGIPDADANAGSGKNGGTKNAAILEAARRLGERKERDGGGRAAEELGRKLGIGASTLYQAKKLVNEAPQDMLDAVKEGKMTIKTAYKLLKNTQTQEDEPRKSA